MTATIAPALAPEDLDRLNLVTALIRTNDTESVIAKAMPQLGAADRAALTRHGLQVGPMFPSVVVRQRLSTRYGVPLPDLTVGILRARMTDRLGSPCELEIFAMVTPPELAHIAADERRHGRENHFALA